MKFLNRENKTLSISTLVFSMTLALGSASVLADNPYSSLDSDKDGMISQPEYNSYMEDDTRRYQGWDQNQDSRFDENEWNDAYPGDRDDFNSWDRNQDGYLDNDELYEGSFKNYDLDNDNYLNQDEVGGAADDGLLD